MEEIKNILDLKLKNNDINLVDKILSFILVDCDICKKKSFDDFKETWNDKFYCQRCYHNPILIFHKCVSCFKYYLSSNHNNVCGICLKNCNVYCCGCLENIGIIEYHCSNHAIYYWLPLAYSNLINSDEEIEIPIKIKK